MRTTRLRLLMATLGIALSGLTGVAVLIAHVRFGIVAPGVDLLVNQTAALIALAVVWMSWFRYRETKEGNTILIGSAFLLLAVTSIVFSVASLTPADRELGLTLDAPGQAPLYTTLLTRAAAAGLLILGLATRQFAFATSRRALAALLAPTAIAALLAPFVWLAEPVLPPLIGQHAVAILMNREVAPGALPGRTVLAIVMHLGVVLLFAAGALRAASWAEHGGPPSAAYLAVGLLVAAFAQVHALLYPGAYATLLTSGDLLRLAVYGILLVGLYLDTRRASARLREANVMLERLRETDAARAMLQERAWLAREVHDGLAQNLWLAKLRLEDVGRAETLAEARQAADVVGGIVDEGIADARRSVLALRAEAVSDLPLAEVLRHQVALFSREAGMEVELSFDAGLGRLSPRAAAELLRIVSEALTNVRKHADATLVRLQVLAVDSVIRVQVTDNGVGFRPSQSQDGGVGLQGMRERAELVGGRLVVESAPHAGTTIMIELPAAAP